MMNWTVCLARHSMTTLRVVGVFSRWIDSDHVTYPPNLDGSLRTPLWCKKGENC